MLFLINSAGVPSVAPILRVEPPNTISYLPSVTNVSPNLGPVAGGTMVKITGNNFNEASEVHFGSTNATSFTVGSEGSITAVSPPGTGAADVTVTTPAGTSAASAPEDQFRYLAPPTVTKLHPASGPVTGETSVTITGTNFIEPTVKFGSTNASSVAVTEGLTQITAVSPPTAAGTVEVTVTTPGGTSAISSADRFAFVPTVSGLSPNFGPRGGGTSLTVSGTGFALGKTATIFKFGLRTAKSVDCTSTTECTVLSPAHEVGTIIVTATVNKVSSIARGTADQFTYN
jgi:hypothetical protein